ncbi:MAG TPA: M20/M25/M40 family metallo-hydrolase [Thermoanaerobaculia bacterium]|nr:M20/M25/M40 family metallo-hydrolase [Thermoanaerobaculia bacterium]
MRRAIVVALPLLVVLALAAWRIRGPEPKGEEAAGFSSARAMKTLRELLVDGVPHPIGSRANARVRARLVTQFRTLGYETRVQSRFVCNAAATCAQVENVYATRGGRGDVVLGVAHYDSVGAGMGASDDGTGVAALLETARVLRDERLRNPVAFLVTDGEEAGLLGAEAFIADEALSRDVAVVVNVETRGTSGLSNMFETSPGNRWLIRHLAEALERPQATSFFYAVYNLLPNDTDVTVFKRAGKAAVNYAAIGGVHWYHTAYDDLAHADARTLQHHGDNVLATIRALANADLAARSRTDATYFDLLGFHLVWWPQEWTLWIAIVSLLLLMIGARKQPPREMTFGVLTAFAAILLALLAGTGVSSLARLRSGGINFVAQPLTSIAAMWLTGLAAAFFAAALFRKRAKARPMLYGVAIVWHMIGIALAVQLPGAAFLFIVPALFVALCALLDLDETVTAAIASTVAAILIFPMGLMFYDALGGRLMVAIALFIGVLATLFAPLWPRFGNGAIALLLALVCAVAAMLQPPYDAVRPRRLSLSYIDDPSPRWFVYELTPQLERAARFAPAGDAMRGPGFAAPAPPGVPRVTMTATRNGATLTVRVRSSRDANRVTLQLKGDVNVLRVNGVAPAPRPPRFRARTPRGWHYAIAHGVSEMTVECTARGPVEAIGSDLTFGLPASGAALIQARQASTAIPVQDGDVTITRTRAVY